MGKTREAFISLLAGAVITPMTRVLDLGWKDMNPFSRSPSDISQLNCRDFRPKSDSFFEFRPNSRGGSGASNILNEATQTTIQGKSKK